MSAQKSLLTLKRNYNYYIIILNILWINNLFLYLDWGCSVTRDVVQSLSCVFGRTEKKSLHLSLSD